MMNQWKCFGFCELKQNNQHENMQMYLHIGAALLFWKILELWWYWFFLLKHALFNLSPCLALVNHLDVPDRLKPVQQSWQWVAAGWYQHGTVHSLCQWVSCLGTPLIRFASPHTSPIEPGTWQIIGFVLGIWLTALASTCSIFKLLIQVFINSGKLCSKWM